jgi:zinc protease
VAGIFLDEMKRLGTAVVAPAELESRKAAVVGDFARSLESSAGLAMQLSSLALYGIDPAQMREYVARVQAVQADQVLRFARATLDPDRAVLLIVGNSAAFLDALRVRFPDLVVIPSERLDLNAPGLGAGAS